jgi:hypothetical protein
MAGFSAATVALGKSDVRLSDEQLTLLEDMAAAIRSTGALTGGLAAVEGYAIHRDLLASRQRYRWFDPGARSPLWHRGLTSLPSSGCAQGLHVVGSF